MSASVAPGAGDDALAAARDGLRAFVSSEIGLRLDAPKLYLIDARLAPVADELGLPGLPGLAAAVRAGSPLARRRAVEAMLTHETQFFRDARPFEALRDHLARLLDGRAPRQRLRLWSAATATGQEAYSLAMLLDDLGPALDGRRVDLLATDASAAAIERARAGLYSQYEAQRGLPVARLLTHFEKEEGGWRAARRLRERITFEVANLLDGTGRYGAFDVILCRNLMIYLEPALKAPLLARLAAQLAPGGVLVLGAGETVLGLTDVLEPGPGGAGFYVAAGSGRTRAAA